MSLLEKTLNEWGLGADAMPDVSKVLKLALRNGGSMSELFFEETRSTRISYESGKDGEGARVEQLIDGTDRGVGLRILNENRSVYGYTTDVSQQALESLALALSNAVQGGAARAERKVEWQKSRQPASEIASYRIGRSPRELPLGEKIKLAERIEKAARGELPAARRVSAVVMDSYRKILTINSDGLLAPDEKTYFTLIAQVVGEKNGRVESAHEVESGYAGLEFLDEVSPEEVGRVAARRVKTLLDAKPAPAGTMPVILAAEAGGTMIHEAVGHGLEADLACNGLSVYQGKVGQPVASPLISVIDDGTLPGKRGSFAFDDEGTPSQKTVLIENGVLKGYMVDRLSAMKFDLMATGNGRRESFRHKPIVRMTNTYIAPGKDDPEQILKDTERGIFVKSMGGGQVNTVTGDFVFAVTEGYLIENGRIREPIRGATLVGNGPKALSLVDRVGSDLGFEVGTCGKDGQGAPVTDAQPTLRIPELTVGGEVPMTDYWPKSK